MPRRLRTVAILCLVLSALCGSCACNETGQMFFLEDLRNEQVQPSALWLPPGQDAAVGPKLTEAVQRYPAIMASVLESMREVRVLTLLGLCIACALAFVGAHRMLKPQGLPREGVRRLAGSALAAGVLRTIDGAQWAVVVQKEWANFGRTLASLPSSSDETRLLHALAPSMTGIGLVCSIGWTVLVAGTFLLASQYFRSEAVKKIVSQDADP